jgi:imidazole glycerol-phosphate synthase subunit HisH
MIAIINYGIGNINAFIHIYTQLKIPVSIVSCEKDLETATKIILPGVGAFDQAMQKLDQSGLRPILEQKVLVQKTPVLGICVGMQMLGDNSEEGKTSGLGWIKGRVRKLNFDGDLPLPHMGWNDVEKINDSPLLTGLSDTSFYFLHSYYFDCENSQDAIAVTDYGKKFTCMIHCQNVYGVQFHPEKSHDHGIQLLKNFANVG